MKESFMVELSHNVALVRFSLPILIFYLHNTFMIMYSKHSVCRMSNDVHKNSQQSKCRQQKSILFLVGISKKSRHTHTLKCIDLHRWTEYALMVFLFFRYSCDSAAYYIILIREKTVVVYLSRKTQIFANCKQRPVCKRDPLQTDRFDVAKTWLNWDLRL